MNKKRKINPILIILCAALALAAATFAVVLMRGYRYNTLANGAKFIGESKNGQPVSGTIRYQNGAEAELDFYNRTIKYQNGDVYVGDISGGCREGRGTMTFSATGDVYEGDFKNDAITGSGKYTYANGDV